MKKALLRLLPVWIVLWVFICPVQAQRTTFGIHVDPMVSWFSTGRKADNDGIRLGIRGGLDIDRFFAYRYAFHTGIFIQQSGGRLLFADTIPVRTSLGTDTLPAGIPLVQGIQQIGIPLGLKFKTDEIGYTTFYFTIGMVPRFRIKAEAKGEPESLVNADIREEVPWLNLGYQVGGGAEYSLGGNTALIIGLVFHGGITPFTTRENEQTYDKNIAIRAGILF
ncbi:MAG TPA: hypothetical protein ENN63_03445 [Bacteroidetes bacterium]|mgnify:CR=1 FL=1|nr:hypothetical protein [Bacteroidota bacterium]